MGVILFRNFVFENFALFEIRNHDCELDSRNGLCQRKTDKMEVNHSYQLILMIIELCIPLCWDCLCHFIFEY
jgi:hypothetical protein